MGDWGTLCVCVGGSQWLTPDLNLIGGGEASKLEKGRQGRREDRCVPGSGRP